MPPCVRVVDGRLLEVSFSFIDDLGVLDVILSEECYSATGNGTPSVPSKPAEAKNVRVDFSQAHDRIHELESRRSGETPSGSY